MSYEKKYFQGDLPVF